MSNFIKGTSHPFIKNIINLQSSHILDSYATLLNEKIFLVIGRVYSVYISLYFCGLRFYHTLVWPYLVQCVYFVIFMWITVPTRLGVALLSKLCIFRYISVLYSSIPPWRGLT